MPMMRTRPALGLTSLIFLWASPVAAGPATVSPAPSVAPADKKDTHYQQPYASIQLAIAPPKGKVSIQARLRVIPPAARASDTLTFSVPASCRIQELTLNDATATYTRKANQVSVTISDDLKKSARFVLALTYEIPLSPSPADDATLRLNAQGLSLPPTALWLPTLPDGGKRSASVHVRAPGAWQVLGSNHTRSVDAEGVTHFEFSATQAPGLCAGPWRRHALGSADVFTPSRTPVWLPVAERVLKQLQSHSGSLPQPPYRPTLCELPAGFGEWHSATLVTVSGVPSALHTYLAFRCFGERGLTGQLPWLTHSLMAYLVARDEANWDASKARVQSQHLPRYLDFLSRSPQWDRPLDGPVPARAWAGVVLNKGVVIWDVLQREVGDTAFWKLLGRLVQRTGSTSRSAEPDLQGADFDAVRAYLDKTGLPRPRLDAITVNASEKGYRTQLSVVQRAPFFKMPTELLLISEQGIERTRFQSFAERIPLEFVTTSRPLRLILDPDERIPMERRAQLRLTDALRSSQAIIVYGTMGTPAENQAMRAAADMLRRRLNLEWGHDSVIRADRDLNDDERRRTLWLLGRPDANAIASEWVNQFPVRYLDKQALWWQGRSWRGPETGVVQMIANPTAPSESVVLIGASNNATFKRAWQHLARPSTFCIFNQHQVHAEGLIPSSFPDPGTDIPLY